MSHDFANEISTPPSKTNWLLTILLVAAAGCSFAWFLHGLMHPFVPPSRQHPSVGRAAPPIAAAGWLNGPAPTAEDLAGKICVIESWAFWCRPCLQVAPHTAALYEQYKDRGVVFIGLTSEGPETLKQTRQFVERARIIWSTGYGAGQTLIDLYQSDEAPVPWAWVLDRQGRIAWAGHPGMLNEKLLDELLKDE